MPNHITNVITAPKHVIDRLMDDDGNVDFTRLIPEPSNIEKGGCSGHHEPGVVCWYTWSIENWGTKWNAYSTERTSDTEVRFDTAWSHPLPVIEALATAFPTESIEIKYADEDLGHNFGHYTVNGPSILEEHEVPEAGSTEAALWAYQIKYDPSATMDDLMEEYGEWFDEDDES